MFIKSMSIKNFRGIEDQEFDLNRLSIVLGRNGSGKSTVLHAMNYFFDLKVRATRNDYFAKDQSREIEIGLTFYELSEAEANEFSSYLHDGELNVVKIFNENADNGLYHSFALQDPRFLSVRQAARKSDQLSAYRILKREIEELPNATSADAALEALEEYENRHPNECERLPKPGQFLGTRNVGGGSLDNHTRFVFIPAVNSAEEQISGRSGAIHELISAISDSYLKREDIRELAEEYRAKVGEIFSNEDDESELSEIANGINQILEDYAEESAIRLYWDEPEEPSLKLPEVIREIYEGDLGIDIKRVGHGLQRSLVIAILQYMALLDSSEDSPLDVIIAFEEPEIYQHPSKCKFLSELLRKLTDKQGKSQVVLVTHSPYFVDAADFLSMLYARKYESESADGVKATKLESLDVEKALDKLSVCMGADRAQLSAESLVAHSKPIFNTIVSESFFASKVIFVEGETEVGVFSAVQEILNLQWESKGIAVVPCGGKTKLDKPCIVASGLGIDTFVVFDKDSSANDDEKFTKGLQRIVGVNEDDVLDPESSVISGNALIFGPKIEEYFKICCGEEYIEIAEQATIETENDAVGPAKAMKRAETVKRFIEIAFEDRSIPFPLIWEFAQAVTD